MSIARLLCAAVGLVLIAYGLACAISPSFIAGPAGLVATASGLTELRATYGGIQIGFGAFCLWGCFRPAVLPSVLAAMVMIFAAVAVCRGFGLVVDVSANGFHLGALAFEALVAGLAAWLYVRAGR